ncbi:MAG TPA: BadF/BadG/BcrA/BcrD ATPase family protein [Bryobacteraceae bacterium]|nr:BadF/BadG/BcrA/BcrD ATPase family protein [Bryobacteraceae bacterium]
MSEYFLGIDGGQSSTTALIGDGSGQVIGYGRGGPCNHVGASEGRAKFTSAVQTCVSAACERASLDESSVRFRSACFGLSGGPADKEAILREMLRCDQMVVTHDGVIALSGATGGAPGVIVIGGTGSISFGRNRDGKSARAGGWGYIFGDEGGGFDIVRQALRAALRAEEGWGPPTVLRDVLLENVPAQNANEILHRFYTVEFPRSRVATLANVVDETANRGDRIAAQILDKAAQELAMLAAAVRRQIFTPGEPALVAFIGGVFRSKRLLERFRTLVELEPGNRLVAPLYGPGAGALIEAYRTAGLNVTISKVPEVEKQ